MNQIANQGQVQITPYAILAAVLFNINKPEEVEIPADDGGEPIKVMAESIAIESEGDALVCVIPIEKVLHFAQTVYDCKVRIDNANGAMFVTFEQKKDGGGLVAANGQPIATQSFAINKLMERLNGGN
jgi:hypothetical protein